MRPLALVLALILAHGALLSQGPQVAPNARKIAKKLSSSELRWPKGVVPYIVADGVVEAENIVPAIEEWNSKTVIEFVPRRKQRSHVAFVSVEGGYCRAALGRVGGRQEIFIPPSGCSVDALIHEIGHAVGLEHEHERSDRDQHISMRPENLSGEAAYHSDGVIPLGLYDYASTMHYAPYSFSRNGRAVFETIPPGIAIPSSGLSPGDINKVAWMYGQPPEKVTVSTNPPGLQLIIDGERVETPHAFEWSDGSTHELEAVSPQYRNNSRYLFARWTSTGARRHKLVIDPTTRWIQASFIEQRPTPPSKEAPDGYLTIRSESEQSWRASRHPQSSSENASPVGEPIPLNGNHPIQLPAHRFRYKTFFGKDGYRVEVPPDATELEITAQATGSIHLYVRHRFPNARRFEGKGAESTFIYDARAPSPSTFQKLVLNRSSKPLLRPGTYHIGLVTLGPSGQISGQIRTTVTRGAGSTLTVRPQALTMVTSSEHLPLEQEITLSHAGCSPVRYIVRKSYPWLDVNPSQWTPQGDGRIDVSVSTTDPSLAVGTRIAYLQIEKERTDPRCDGIGKILVPIHYVVTPRPAPTGSIQLRPSAPTSVIRIEDDEPFLIQR